MSKNKEEAFNFEKGLSRLEDIVTLFDEGGLSLEQMEAYFEEGMMLIQQCSQRLDRTETKVTQLLSSMKESLAEKPFDEESE